MLLFSVVPRGSRLVDLEAGGLGDREGWGALVESGDEEGGIHIVGAGCREVVVGWVVVGREGGMGLMSLLAGMGMNGVHLEDLVGIGIAIGIAIEGAGGKVTDVTLFIWLFNSGNAYDECSTASMLRKQV